MFRWQTTGNAVGPLHQTHAVAFEVLVGAEVEEIALSAETVGVEVANGEARLVLLNQNKRWTADDPTVGDAEPLGHGARQVGLAGAEGADQCHHGTGEQELAEP